MRVEFIYTPQCDSYRKALNTLETVIAEERLPIPIELVEATGVKSASHTIKIDGNEMNEQVGETQGEFCRLYDTKAGVGASPSIDHVREALWRKWKEITESPLTVR